MAPIPVVAPTIIRYSMNQTIANGRKATVILDISVDETGVSRAAAVNAVTPDVVQQYQDNVCSQFPTSITFIGASFTDLDSLDGISGTQGPISGHPVHGSGTGAQQAPQVCTLIHKICSHDRQQRNGRMFFPWITEASVGNDGLVDPAHVTFMNDMMNGLKDDLADLSATTFESVAWRVVHVEGHAPDGRPNAWSSSDITSLSCDSRVATQRRRNRG